MLSTNSAPWPIASSHQHRERTPYHALHTVQTTATLHSALCVRQPSCSLLKLSLTRDQLSFFIDPPRLSGQPGWPGYPRRPDLALPYPVLSCPVSRVPDRDTALTATASYPTR